MNSAAISVQSMGIFLPSVIAGAARAVRRKLYSSSERLPCLPRFTVRRHRQSWRARERFDEGCIPRPSGFRAFLAPPSGVIVSRGGRASGSTKAVFLVRAASVPSSLHRLASSSVVAGTRAVRRKLYSSSERLPCLPRFTVWRHRQSWRARERFDESCIRPPSGFTARCRRRASGSTNAVLLVRAVPPPSSAVPAGATFLNTPVDRPHTLDTIRLHGGRSCARNPRELRVRDGAPGGPRGELRLLPGRWRAARGWSRSRSPRSR